MRTYLRHHWKIAAIWIVIALAGGVVALLTYRTQEMRRRLELMARAEIGAIAFDDRELRKLRGTKEDAASADYATLKEKLRQMRRVDPKVRFVYVFRVRSDTGKVIFLADSAAPGDKDESKPGDEYPQAPQSPGLQSIMRSGQPANEGPLADDFGTWVTGYAAIGFVGRSEGRPTHLLGIDVDATDWQRELMWHAVESALLVWFLFGLPLGAWLLVRRQREQNEVIRNLFEAMEQSLSAIMITDREGRVEYANRGLCRQLGYARRELLGHSWRNYQANTQGSDKLAAIGASIRAGTAWEGEWYSKRKDGAEFPVRGGFTPVKDRDGTIACFVAVFDDVSETKRREEELREATELAQSADRAKSQFLATMSHEVRTPLNGIVGFSSLLLETPLTPEQTEYVQTIRVSTEALIQLTGDILDFARIEAGRVKLDPAPCDPRECVEEALDLLAAKAAEKGLELLHRVDPDVPASIITDCGRLRQVLVNLIGNGVKFTEHGEVEVTVGLAPDAKAPAAGEEGATCTLLFSVRDTGIGISDEHHAKLFRAFSQVDETTTRRFGGTGLGLAISRNLVGLMGGTINVRSTEGTGSVFTFTIHAPVARSAPAPHNLQGIRLALAAPPGALRRELTELLKKWHATVMEVSHTDALAQTEADLVLVDVSPELTSRLAGQAEVTPGWKPAKWIGLVPISTTSELRTKLRRHFRLLVNKPIHHEALFTVLSGSQRRAESPESSAEKFAFRVLVAEDNPVNWRLVKRVLENLGCTPTLAENGQEALDLLAARGREFDLLLLDMHMPVMDGITALRAIRAGQAGADVQNLWIIALTADAREPQRIQAMEAGLNDFLTKPLDVSKLQESLRRLRAEQRAPRTPT